VLASGAAAEGVSSEDPIARDLAGSACADGSMGTSLFIKNQKNSMMQKMVVELMPSCKEPIGKEPYRSTKIDTITFDPLAARAIVVDSPYVENERTLPSCGFRE
jgi:hypothetical protein